MQYLCKTKQQARAQAHAGAPDKDKVPHRGAPCLTKQASPGSASPARRTTALRCLPYQYEQKRSDYYFRKLFRKASSEVVYEIKKRLAKSGKDKTLVKSLRSI